MKEYWLRLICMAIYYELAHDTSRKWKLLSVTKLSFNEIKKQKHLIFNILNLETRCVTLVLKKLQVSF